MVKVNSAWSRQKKQHDQHRRMRCVEVSDPVNSQNYSRRHRRIPGTINQETGPLSARIELEDGRVVRRQNEQVVACPVDSLL